MKNKEKEEIIEALKRIPFYEGFELAPGTILPNDMNWIAADKDGGVYAFNTKPVKGTEEWLHKRTLDVSWFLGKIPGPVKGWKNSLISVKLLRGKKAKEQKREFGPAEAGSFEVSGFKVHSEGLQNHWDKEINKLVTLLDLQETLRRSGDEGCGYSVRENPNGLWYVNPCRYSLGEVAFSYTGALQVTHYLNNLEKE